jgi:hypothetical protein
MLRVSAALAMTDADRIAAAEVLRGPSAPRSTSARRPRPHPTGQTA